MQIFMSHCSKDEVQRGMKDQSIQSCRCLSNFLERFYSQNH